MNRRRRGDDDGRWVGRSGPSSLGPCRAPVLRNPRYTANGTGREEREGPDRLPARASRYRAPLLGTEVASRARSGPERATHVGRTPHAPSTLRHVPGPVQPPAFDLSADGRVARGRLETRTRRRGWPRIRRPCAGTVEIIGDDARLDDQFYNTYLESYERAWAGAHPRLDGWDSPRARNGTHRAGSTTTTTRTRRNPTAVSHPRA